MEYAQPGTHDYIAALERYTDFLELVLTRAREADPSLFEAVPLPSHLEVVDA